MEKLYIDLLKQELNHATIEGNHDHYRLEWLRKREAIVPANFQRLKLHLVVHF